MSNGSWALISALCMSLGIVIGVFIVQFFPDLECYRHTWLLGLAQEGSA